MPVVLLVSPQAKTINLMKGEVKQNAKWSRKRVQNVIPLLWKFKHAFQLFVFSPFVTQNWCSNV